jgi:tetratricopeptide (TPR) repeat protein
VGAIAPRLERAETERAKRKPTENLDAYDCYLQAMAKFYEETPHSNNEALRLLYRSMELDPDYAAAHGMAAWCYARAKTNGWTSDPVKEKAEAAKLARRAVNLGNEDSVALGAAGFALAYSVGAFDEGVAAVDRALALNPNDPAAWNFSGTLRLWMGEPELALEHLARATRLNPLDLRVSGLADVVAAFAHFFAGRYDEACLRVEQAIRHRPNFVPALLVSAGSHALAGRISEANKAMARLRELKPNLRVGDLNDQIPVRRPADLARCEEGLRLAGLPES